MCIEIEDNIDIEKIEEVKLYHGTSEVIVVAQDAEIRISIKKLRSLFPKAIVSNHKHSIATSDMKHHLMIPLNSKFGKAVYSDIEVARLTAIEEQNYNFIPQELREKYCIIFRNQVLETADTMEEAEAFQKDNYGHIQTVIYIPIK